MLKPQYLFDGQSYVFFFMALFLVFKWNLDVEKV